MNESALLTEIKTQLIAQTWTGSSNVVFPTGSVKVVPSIAEALANALNTMRTPIALVEPGTAESDPEHDEEPDLIRMMPNVALFSAIAGDAIGENAVLGGYKVNGTTRSEGRGIVELSQELYNAVGKLNALESVTMQVRQKGEQVALFKPPGMWIVYRLYQLEAWGTTT